MSTPSPLQEPLLSEVRRLAAQNLPVLALKVIRQQHRVPLAEAVKLLQQVTGQPVGTRLVSVPVEVCGVALDDPTLGPVIARLIEEDDAGAVSELAESHQLSAVEAEQVVHAMLAEGRPTAYFIVADKLGWVSGDGLRQPPTPEARVVGTGATGRVLVLDRPSKAEETWLAVADLAAVLDVLDQDRTSPDQSYSEILGGIRSELNALREPGPTCGVSLLGGVTLTMPSVVHPEGVRSVALADIDAVFGVLDGERVLAGREQDAYLATLDRIRGAARRYGLLERAFLAVNELCPPLDWLRDLKAATHDPDALTALRDRARAERAAELEAHGRQATLPFVTVAPDAFGTGWTVTVRPPTDVVETRSVVVEEPKPDPVQNCGTCQHAGAYSCDLMGELRSEALAWRASNTTGDGCPGWSARSVAFVTPTAPAQPKVEVFDDPRPDWLPEGWRYDARTGRYAGPDGEYVLIGDNQHAVAWGSRHADVEAWTEWTERDKRALVLALDDPQGTIDAAAIRDRAEHYLLSDRDVDADAREVAQHDAAMYILRGVGDGPDPRTTLRGDLEMAHQTIAGLSDLLGQRVVADGDLTVPQVACCAYLSLAIEHNPAALNFLEEGWTWVSDDGTPRSYTATVQRVEGKTPGQMITELKAEVARLEEENRAIRECIALSPLYTCSACGAGMVVTDLHNVPACAACGSSAGYVTHQQEHAVRLVADLRARVQRLQAEAAERDQRPPRDAQP